MNQNILQFKHNTTNFLSRQDAVDYIRANENQPPMGEPIVVEYKDGAATASILGIGTGDTYFLIDALQIQQTADEAV
jgi:hypothetical protein